MLGSALTYTASRLASRAVDSVERKIVWSGISAILMIAALVFVLTATFLYLQTQFGTLNASLLLAGTCCALGVVFFWMPSILDNIEKYADDETTAEKLGDAIDQEAEEAVDTFGALQVGVSAFMLGLNAARSIKKRA